MKKLYASIICTLLFAHLLHAQLGTWTWVKGDSSKNIKSIYGQKGISSAANKPGSRVRSFTWTDAAGNLYLYGGEEHHPTLDSTLKLNDLWKYNIRTNEWTWLSGDSMPGKSAVYGVQGLASASNSPGSRQWGSSWADAIGNFWLSYTKDCQEIGHCAWNS